MGEIKFRAKDVYTGEWRHGYVVISESKERGVIIRQGSVWREGWDIDVETVGQYTGIKDKNDVEIYDGDYLNCDDNMLHRISWWDNQAKFILETWDGESFEIGLCDYLEDWIDINESKIKYLTVTGNIHENPELMETNP